VGALLSFKFQSYHHEGAPLCDMFETDPACALNAQNQEIVDLHDLICHILCWGRGRYNPHGGMFWKPPSVPIQWIRFLFILSSKNVSLFPLSHFNTSISFEIIAPDLQEFQYSPSFLYSFSAFRPFPKWRLFVLVLVFGWDHTSVPQGSELFLAPLALETCRPCRA
jgi:hypothetical protein